MTDTAHPLPHSLAGRNPLPDFITCREALFRLRQIKAVVEVNRQLAAALSDLNEMSDRKIRAAERMAQINDDTPNARKLRHDLWSEMETAHAGQKLRTYQCARDILALTGSAG